MNNRTRHRPSARGFTLIEILVVVGIMGIFLIVSYPSILNVMAVRNLDNTTREIQTYLQQAKLQAVSTKIVHRVRFHQPERDLLGLRDRAAPDRRHLDQGHDGAPEDHPHADST